MDYDTFQQIVESTSKCLPGWKIVLFGMKGDDVRRLAIPAIASDQLDEMQMIFVSIDSVSNGVLEAVEDDRVDVEDEEDDENMIEEADFTMEQKVEDEILREAEDDKSLLDVIESWERMDDLDEVVETSSGELCISLRNVSGDSTTETAALSARKVFDCVLLPIHKLSIGVQSNNDSGALSDDDTSDTSASTPSSTSYELSDVTRGINRLNISDASSHPKATTLDCVLLPAPRYFPTQKSPRTSSKTLPHYILPSLPEEKLVETPTLTLAHCKYNTRYRLIICMLCHVGIPLSLVPKHAKSPTRNVKVVRSDGAIDLLAVPHHFKLGKDEVVIETIKKELLKLQPGAEIRDHIRMDDTQHHFWAESPLALDGQEGPILGLTVFENAYICNSCHTISMNPEDYPSNNRPYAALSPGSMVPSSNPLHRACKGRSHTRGAVQTFASDNSYCRFFPVKRTSSVLTDPAKEHFQKLAPADILNARLRSIIAPTTSHEPTQVSEIREEHGFYVESGIHNFMSKFSIDHLRNLIALPHLTSRTTPLRLKRLHKLVGKTFMADCGEVIKAHSAFRHAISNCAPHTPRPVQLFSPPALPKSKAVYAITEVHFLWTVVEYERKFRIDNSSQISSNEIFTFNSTQSSAIQRLDEFLSSKEFDLEAAAEAKYDVLDACYFPENTTIYGRKPFTSPLKVYNSLWCINRDKNATDFVPLYLYPVHLSKMQFSMRLAGFHKQNEILKSFDNDDPEAEDPEWHNNILLPFCRKYLQEHKMTPFADLRYLIRRSSRIVRGMRRPWMIEWIDEDTLRVKNGEVNKNVLAKHIQAGILELRTFIEEEILEGISLEELGISFDLNPKNDSGDEKTLGYSPLESMDSSGLINNEDSDKVLNAMVAQGKLGLRLANDGDVLFDRTCSMRWISNVHAAWVRFYPLNHQTAGPPGRGSEEALFNLCNTNKSRRHVYFKNGTIGFASNYHKGHLSGGMYKYILRLLPYDLAVIFMILVRIVRPIELLALTEFFVERENINKVVDIYQTKVYASWGHAWTSENLSAAIADWFKKHFGFAVGIRLYRHIAISIGRRYLDYTKETNPYNNALAKMAGHTQNIEQKDYAVEKGSTGNYQADEMYYAKISRDWHAMFGLRTTK